MDLTNELIRKGVLKTPYIIEAFKAIPRFGFMRADLQALSEIDEPFPIGAGQTISQPSTVAFMLELLKPKPGQAVLEIGMGSGWQTALLSHVVGGSGRVYGLELLPELCEFGKNNLESCKAISKGSFTLYCKNAVKGLPKEAARFGGFDRIIAAAAGNKIPEAWKNQLKIGGRLVAPVGNSIMMLVRKGEHEFEIREYPGFMFVPLVAPPAPRRFKKNIGVATLASVLLLGATLGSAYAFSAPSSEFPKEITIEENASARKVAKILQDQGIIRSETLFLGYLMFQNGLERIQPGIYFFENKTPLSSVIQMITNPGTRKVVKVRILEGSSLLGVAEAFEKAGLFSKEELWRITGVPGVEAGFEGGAASLSDWASKFSMFEGPYSPLSLEGYLFPDTYEFFDDATPEEVVFKMLATMQERLESENLMEEIAKQNRSVFEIITIASLLEREAMTYEDKQIIAGIIQNRIKKGLPLQLDASLMYVTGRGSHLLTQTDLKLDSPYNTYLYKGLPLGPIANPSLDSIKAALYPKETPYLFYLSDASYKIYYSETYEEHQQKKALYIQ